jgi:hypothetical protein
MTPISEIRQLLAWGGTARFIRPVHALAAKVARWLWPPVNTLVAAQHAALYGFLACIMIGADFFGTDSVFANELPLSMAVMAPLLHLVLAAGWFFAGLAILKYSRTAAVVALAAYAVIHTESMVAAGSASHPVGTALAIALVLMLTSSLRGAFAYHHLKSETTGAPGPPLPSR